jgi:hypothetical protein
MAIVIFSNACAPLVPVDQWHTRAIEKEHLFLDQKNPKIAYTHQQPRSWKPIEVLLLERKARQAPYRVKLNLTGEEADVTTSSFADSEASWAVRSYGLFDPVGEDAGDHASMFGRFHGGDSPGGSWAVR